MIMGVILNVPNDTVTEEKLKLHFNAKKSSTSGQGQGMVARVS
jgi:hypothetical protein